MASHRTLRALVPGLILLVLSVATCRLDMLLKPSAKSAQPQLAVTPTTVRDSARAGSDDVRRIEIELLNGGTGDGEYSWEAEDDRPWIRLSPRDGTLPDTMVITLDAEDLDPDTHEGTITITAPGMPDSQVTIAVTFIAQRAGLNVSPGSIEHSANVGSGAVFDDTLRISNGGNGPLVWTVRKDRPWVTLGAVAGSGPGIVPVTINTTGLPEGTHRDEIVVTAPGASGSPKRIDVTVTVFSPGLAVTPGQVRDTVPPGTTETQSHTVRVSNSGTGAMTWSASKSAPWVSLSATAGSAPQDVIVTLSPAGMASGAHTDTIVFNSPEATNDPIRVPVELVISQPGLTVTPAAIVDAATQGDVTKRTHTLNVGNSGPGALGWFVSANAGWIEVGPPGGIAPSTITVTLNPASLPAGTHQGAVTVTAPGASGSPAVIPVTLTIGRACGEIVLTPDEVRQGVLSETDCEAPHRPGRRANVYRVALSAGDNFSVRLTASFNAYLILVNSAGAVLAENDECSPETGTACIMNFPIPATGEYVIEATSANPGEGGPLTITVVRERAPIAPQGLGQFRQNGTTSIPVGGTTPEDAVIFTGRIADPNPQDAVRLEIELEPLGSPFTGTATHSSDLVPMNGSGVNVSVPAGGLQQTGYHWQARTCDRTGRCSAWLSFGLNAESDADFTVAVPPGPTAPDVGNPAQFQGDGTTPIPTGGSAAAPTVVLTAAVSDLNAGDVLRLEMEVKEATAAFTGADLHSAAGLASGSVGSVSFSPLGGAGYHWRARVCDQTDRCSGWASFPQPSPNPEDQPDFVGQPAGTSRAARASGGTQ
jgi:hypothetical protein